METKEIIDIIVGILASIGLTACIIAAAYCTYSLAKLEKEE